MPTKEKGWMPSQLREAWTIGMENVLSASEIRSAGLTCSSLPEDASLGFFLQDANWNQSDAPLTFSIDPESVLSIRTTLHSGSLVSHVTLKTHNAMNPIILIGKGTVDPLRPLILGIGRFAVLR